MSHAVVYDPSQADFADRAHEIYRELRDHHPVYRDPTGRFWALSRFEDVRAAASDPAAFSSENTSISQGLLPMLQQLDPPRHDQLRELLWRAFTPRRVAAMEPRIREISRELIDRFAADGRCDLLGQFASQLPSRVIGDLIGIPTERQPAFLEWTESLIGASLGAELDVNPFAQIYGEFAKLLEERRDERRDDLMSALLDAEVDGQRLSQQELLGFCFLLVVGGNDTTTNLLANGAVLLARHPDQRDALVREPGLLPDAVEEMLRYDAPTQALPRRTTRDVGMRGKTIPADEEIMLLWGAANHDEREFEDPERFDIRRRPRRHLAFGHGTHFCMGAHLARMEARVAFEELLGRIPAYELEGEPRWQRSTWARAYEAVPIVF
jgi:cytochrome P450